MSKRTKRQRLTRGQGRRPTIPIQSVRSGIWQQPDFVKVWAGESLSLVGSEVTTLALPLTAVLVLHASTLQVSVLSGVVWLPSLLALFAGVWIDGHRRRPVLIMTNLGRALSLGIIPLAFVGHWLSFVVLVGSALVTGTLTVGFTIAYGCYLPTLVRRDELIAGNSALQTSASVAKMGGPSLAGVLIQLWAAPLVILVDALSFLVAGLSVLTIQQREPPPVCPTPAAAPWHAMRVGMRLMLRQPLMRAMCGMAAVYNGGEAAILGILSSYALRDLHLSALALGSILASGSVGALLGSVGAPHLARHLGTGNAWCLATAVSGGAWLLVPLAQGTMMPVLLVTAFAANGAGMAVVNICIKTLRAEVIPPALLGRITSTYLLCALGVVPLGALLGGVLQGSIGMRATLLVSALVTVVAFPCVWRVRHPRAWVAADDADAREPASVEFAEAA